MLSALEPAAALIVVVLLVAAAGRPSAAIADVAAVPPVAAGYQLPTSTTSSFPSFCYLCLTDKERLFVLCFLFLPLTGLGTLTTCAD